MATEAGQSDGAQLDITHHTITRSLSVPPARLTSLNYISSALPLSSN